LNVEDVIPCFQIFGIDGARIPPWKHQRHIGDLPLGLGIKDDGLGGYLSTAVTLAALWLVPIAVSIELDDDVLPGRVRESDLLLTSVSADERA
jgi:hypothetical protein